MNVNWDGSVRIGTFMMKGWWNECEWRNEWNDEMKVDWLYCLACWKACLIDWLVIWLDKELNCLSFWLRIDNPRDWNWYMFENNSLEKWEGKNDKKSEKSPRKAKRGNDWKRMAMWKRNGYEKDEKKVFC